MKGFIDTIELTLDRFKGGKVFFDNLDSNLTKTIYIDLLIDTFHLIKKYNNISLSGNFGSFFWIYYHQYFDNIVLFNGSLGGQKPLIKKLKGRIDNESFIFIDDSIYSGITLRTVEQFLKMNNSQITNTYVLYDGSLKKEDNIYSLYRYYN
ncbi:MAG: hypothetical protein AB7S48_09620 [Bacteroidales bacterium]